MNKVFFLFLFCTTIGCAKVSLETAKPLKVDVTMRIDVYQHVQKDAASIEDQVYGSSEKQFNYNFIMGNVYAQSYSLDVGAAIERRKNRAGVIEKYFSQGYIGETKTAYLKAMDGMAQDVKAQVEQSIIDENSDRGVIYKFTAEKNNADISETEKIFYNDHFQRAQAGYWFEICDQSGSNCQWKKK